MARVTGDSCEGNTFKADFEGHEISYDVSKWTAHQLYEALEPRLHAHEVVLLDAPKLEQQQQLGLMWRGGKIDHQAGEHDDYSNAAAGVVQVLAARASYVPFELLFTGSSGEIAELDAEIARLNQELNLT